MLLSAEHIEKNYGMKQLVRDASLYVDTGDKVGIIGMNGTGKSTLLRILAQAEEPDSGTVQVFPNVRISYMPQNADMNEQATVLEQVFLGLSQEYREIAAYEARTMLNRLGITDYDKKIGALSGGQRKRVALATALIQPADVLILDEPTNHLDMEMAAWLEDYLRRFAGGMLLITHDRYFLDRVVNRIVELENGRLYSYETNYAGYLDYKAERMEMESASERKRQSVLRREHQWIMRGARARGTKSRDRIARYEALRAQEAPAQAENIRISALSERMGRKTIELEHVCKGYGLQTVIADFSYHLTRDDRIGVVGVNGAGKSTLLNLIAGRIQPDSGTVSQGQTIRIGMFSQEGRELDSEMRVIDFIREISNSIQTAEGTLSASQMLERFLFSGDLQHQKIGKLSGGEKRRVYLLSILMEAPNVLLLDEPTNDLDIETLMILEEYLEEFPGIVIAVSHDRYFLDKMARTIFEVCKGGQVRQYTGNFSDYLEKRQPPEKLELVRAEKAEKIQKEALERLQDEKTERWLYLNELAEQMEAQK